MKIAFVLLSLLLVAITPAAQANDRADQLKQRARELPDIHRDQAEAATEAAITVETERFPAELLIAIAWGESRFITTTRTGRACGPMQTIMVSQIDCLFWSLPVLGFSAGVAELEQWARDRRTHGNIILILLAQACGNSAFDGSCSKKAWPGWVLRRARALGYRRPSS